MKTTIDKKEELQDTRIPLNGVSHQNLQEKKKKNKKRKKRKKSKKKKENTAEEMFEQEVGENRKRKRHSHEEEQKEKPLERKRIQITNEEKEQLKRQEDNKNRMKEENEEDFNILIKKTPYKRLSQMKEDKTPRKKKKKDYNKKEDDIHMNYEYFLIKTSEAEINSQFLTSLTIHLDMMLQPLHCMIYHKVYQSMKNIVKNIERHDLEMIGTQQENPKNLLIKGAIYSGSLGEYAKARVVYTKAINLMEKKEKIPYQTRPIKQGSIEKRDILKVQRQQLQVKGNRHALSLAYLFRARIETTEQRKLEDYNASLFYDPANVLALNNRSMLLMESHFMKEAMDDMELALSLYPTYRLARENLIYLKETMGLDASQDCLINEKHYTSDM
mmetsp:Transcript_7567/g.11235  ORF Transcript_7567/g.11235 Transcript_7567/m.11235 type:complete len:386 (+) Transcript_7567:160-1317(+)